MARDDPDFAIRDLYNAIAQGDYPSYTMYIQVMSFEVSLKKKIVEPVQNTVLTKKVLVCRIHRRSLIKRVPQTHLVSCS